MDGVTKFKKMTGHYKTMLEKGLEFQDFICEALLKEMGINLTMFSSRKYQLSKGENIQGVEIKFDDIYKKTGNIYIEIAEKSNEENENYVISGIYRNDNTWLYLIGNYEEVFIFPKNILVLLDNKKRYKYVQTPTSKGFLINKEDAHKFCAKKIIF